MQRSHFTQGRPGLLLTLSLTLAASRILAKDISPADRTEAARMLDKNRDAVIQAVQGLTPAQWNFKPAPDRWSVAEILEHMTIVEEFVANQVLSHIAEAPAGAPDRDLKQLDALIIAKVPDRSTKVKAPESIYPTGRWSPDETVVQFSKNCAQIADFLEHSPDLRGHVMPHPVLGPLDGYQWILTVSGHNNRHMQQILEVKADPGFPAK